MSNQKSAREQWVEFLKRDTGTRGVHHGKVGKFETAERWRALAALLEADATRIAELEAGCRALEVAEAEAMALVLNHEGRIDRQAKAIEAARVALECHTTTHFACMGTGICSPEFRGPQMVEPYPCSCTPMRAALALLRNLEPKTDGGKDGR